MAKWVEDIEQALINLGGQASLRQIYDEVKRIRKEPLPESWQAGVRERIEYHSSDSLNFKGKDIFRKVDKGVWALRNSDYPISNQSFIQYEKPVRQKRNLDSIIDGDRKSWVEDIIQALKNLGGQATLNQIYSEIKDIRKTPLPESWKANIRGRIEDNSSDSKNFKGKDYFKKIDTGIWALRDPTISSSSNSETNKFKRKKPPEDSIFESFETISMTLRTIKEYREYSHPEVTSSWTKYVQDFFQLFGFHTEELGEHVYLLNSMGSIKPPNAYVFFLPPENNIDHLQNKMIENAIISGFAKIIYTSRNIQIGWGMWTNGLQLKIFQVRKQSIVEKLNCPDLDGIITNERLDSFINIYKVFAEIKGDK